MMSEPQDQTSTAEGQSELTAVVSCEPETEVWVVSNSVEGASFVASHRQGACDHASLMAGDFPEMGPWRVTHYVADPFYSKSLEMRELLDDIYGTGFLTETQDSGVTHRDICKRYKALCS